jgi:peptidoglycan/LPS O-acetylase OafA/YrhL
MWAVEQRERDEKMSASKEPDPAEPLRSHALPGLDGIRGIAILLVMLYHFANMNPASVFDKIFYRLKDYGWSGVDLFFVLSGFLITGILIKAKDAPNYFRNFYARRALRILPLYYGFVAALLLLYPRVGGIKVAREAQVLQEHQIWIWTHMVNWLVAWTGNFWTATPLGTGGFWSLSIEEQFYLVWPAVVLLVPLRHLLRLCVGLILVATATRFAMAAFGASWAAIFTVTFARMDAIAMGAAIAVIARSPVGLNAVKRWAPMIGVSALAVLGAIDIFCRTGQWTTGRLATHCTLFVWLWGALLVATLTALPGSFLQRLTYTTILRGFGKYSYALYLFHGHLNRLFTKVGFDPSTGPVIAGSILPWQMVYLVVAISTSFAIAYLSWHLYEKHFLRLKTFFPTPKLSRPRLSPVATVHHA